MTSQEIREKQFKKAAMFGYKTAEVDEYIKKLAVEYESLEKKNKELSEKLEILAKKVRQYRDDEEQLKNTLLEAQKHAAEISDNAKKMSDMMISDAKSEAIRIVDEAKLKSISMISDARNEYDKIVESTRETQRGSKLALFNLQREVTEFKANLVELYKTHLSKVISMPECVNTDALDENVETNKYQISFDDNTNNEK